MIVVLHMVETHSVLNMGGVMDARVFIAVPTTGVIQADTVASIIGAMGQYPGCAFQALKGTYICRSRETLTVAALNSGASHIFFVDSDMTFPADTIPRLLKHDKMIVGANYRQRFGINDFTAHKDGDYVSSVEQAGLEAVEFMGFGVILINLEALKSMERPWFETDTMGYEGEDVAFCARAEAADIEVFVDHDLSQEVGHLGSFELKVDMYV